MAYRKITEGCVIQYFNNSGVCTSQHFWAGDNIQYEDIVTEMPCSPEDDEQYFPFNMEQPNG